MIELKSFTEQPDGRFELVLYNGETKLYGCVFIEKRPGLDIDAVLKAMANHES